ncbi:MAG: hypothetical protein II817_07155 [Bacteroidales bacterium]|nr:hypothetical protein [Bacteroidales bacterium]
MANTLKQIEIIDNSLQWIKEHHAEHYEQRFLQLVEERRKLRTIAEADINNPGIAAFGKSQVGKSYLISCLLQDKGNPFMVKAGKEMHNFVFAINPPSEEGGGRESTGVVSRFSSFKRYPEKYNPDIPVLVKTFSLTDIIMILADSYFNDSSDYKTISETDIKSICENIETLYKNSPSIDNPIICPDDVLNMKDYFHKHINNAQIFVNSGFFNRLAFYIDRIPDNEYISVFAYLWNKDTNITRLYTKLYNIMKKFGFAKYIYLPIDAVLHHGIRENTIMSVQCLKQLFDDHSTYKTDVYVQSNGKYIKCAENISKSEISAICSEVVFKIEDDFLSGIGSYDLTNIKEDVRMRLNPGEIKMSMLRDNDLLDFPGARSREHESINNLEKDSVLLNFFLRGKVAYLFNKYNEEMVINILLYCHHNKDNDVTELYKLLEDWVNNYVGETPEDRKKKLEMTKVSPLFHIGTMFNLDMTLGVGAQVSEKSIDQRWVGRFDTVVNKQCFHRDSVKWLNNWTRDNEYFQNSYILRDYKFSGPKTGLYSGFEECHKETDMLMSQEYYDLMRDTFIKNKYVKQFFADPELSWDVTATINNDGALYIIEKLAVVAANIDKAREAQFCDTCKQINNRVYSIMKEYYVSDDTAELLLENINKANGIFRELEFVCQSHPEYFGHLIKSLQYTESESFKEIHKLIPNLVSEVVDGDDTQDYQLIRDRCGNFDGCTNEQEKWQLLLDRYHFMNKEDAIAFLKKKNIQVNKLFAGAKVRRKNSSVIANHILKIWQKNISSGIFTVTYAGEDKMDEIVMSNLIDCIIKTAENVGLAERIEKEIEQYTDVQKTGNINEDLVADLVATTISDFIMDFGYHYLEKERIENSKRISNENKLPCFNYIGRERQESFDETAITEMFNEILTYEGRYTPSFINNYNNWIEYMYVALIAYLQVPEYDHEANAELKTILDELNN